MWGPDPLRDSHDGTMPAGRTNNSKRRVADLGEFGLIDRLARLTQQPHNDPFQPPREGEIDVGDDAAIWLPERTGFELLTLEGMLRVPERSLALIEVELRQAFGELQKLDDDDKRICLAVLRRVMDLRAKPNGGRSRRRASRILERD